MEAPATSLASSPCLQGERVAFTGTLASMTHRQAFDEVEKHGGAATANVSRQTTMLVVGEEGWPLEADGTVSKKLEQVSEWRGGGSAVRIVPESEWLHLLGLEDTRRELSRLYTPAMLSQLLRVPVGEIRRWERMGLVRPVKRVSRLPYFDFLEVSAARGVVDLLGAGVSQKVLSHTFDRLQQILGQERFPEARAALLAESRRILYRDPLGLVEPTSGQRYFDFDHADDHHDHDAPSVLSFPEVAPAAPLESRVTWKSEEWRQEADRLLQAGEVRPAIEALRMALMERPADPETHFALAEALYRDGNTAGALERYHAAVEHDHEFVEAWVQLGCIQAERGERESAVDAFRVALDVHPDYPDAHWHLAEMLFALGRTAEAFPHWGRYLEFDRRGPWAEQARQRLELGEGRRDGETERRRDGETE